MASPLDSHDVWMEILLRLPAKSLIRFKSVCKKWLAFISSDHLCLQHTLRRPKLQQSLILKLSHLVSDPDYFYLSPTPINGENVTIPYTFPRDHYEILQACNGLWLLCKNNSNIYKCTYHVYNPTTRQSTEVTPNHNGMCHRVVVMALAFDPSKSPYYKLVCIIFCPDDACQVELFDSESRSWKLSFGPFTLPSFFHDLGIYRRETEYYNNAIYWWIPHDDTYYCFDIAKNEMKELSLPRFHMREHDADPYLQELDGKLYYLTFAYDPVGYKSAGSHGLMAAVWEMDGNLEWVLKRRDCVFSCEGKRHAKFICEEMGKWVKLVSGSDGSLQLIYLQSREMKMRAYNFRHGISEDLVDFTSPPFDHSDHEDDEDDDDELFSLTYHLSAFQFGETLALV